MPELPEVETTRRGLAPHLEGRRVLDVTLRRKDLRWPIPREIETLLPQQTITAIRRRAKYLLMDTDAGTAIWHLGMSGSMRVLPADTPVTTHDHVDLLIGDVLIGAVLIGEAVDGALLGHAPTPALPRTRGRGQNTETPGSGQNTDMRWRGQGMGASGMALSIGAPGGHQSTSAGTSEQSATARVLRFNDPRRFGSLLWQAPGETHALLRDLGPEPLLDDDGVTNDGARFSGDYLYNRSRGRSAPVKAFLMDQKVVVGVGNIYAAEALFAAGVSPLREAGKVSRARYGAIAEAVRTILSYAITRGGTTLRDFLSPDGAPGYFEQELSAYGRGGEPCPRCGRPMKQAMLAQRATVWCGHCQT